MMIFLENAWYAVGHAYDIATKPTRRVVTNVPLVLYRAPDGTVVALHDRCPHRFVPLSAGKVEGDGIACGYHGLRFDAFGVCVHNPHGTGRITPDMTVRSYACAERYGFVWVWMGAVASANLDAIPDYSPLIDETRFTVIRGYIHVAANYELISDNLLDLSHVQYLHPDLARTEGLDSFRSEVVKEGTTVTAFLWKHNCSPSRFQRLFWDSPSTVGDSRAHMRWDAPANLYLDTGITEVDASVEEGVCLPSAHLVTPETEYTSHYFWALGRNVKRDDPALQALLLEAGNRIFNDEDKPMIEMQQAQMGRNTDLRGSGAILLSADAAAMRARATLHQLIAREAGVAADPQMAS
jgi:phenylpropionate dioxygenase-like ring-hydroxylating dioxygenase large terminal subunit